MTRLKLKYILALAAIIAVLIVVTFWQQIDQAIIANSSNRVAVYEAFSFSGVGSNFDEVSISSLQDAELYVALPDGRKFLIKDLPEDAAEKYTQEKYDRRNHPVRPTNEMRYGAWHESGFNYREGKLRYAHFENSKDNFHFSPKRDGPYLRLPTTREQLTDVFGEPLKWRRRGHRGPAW